MTRDDVIRLYGQANGWSPEGWDKFVEELERFAALVAAYERESCARAAEFVVPRHTECGNKIAAAIRARGSNGD